MIPKQWRDYMWQVRPLVVLIYLVVSPAVVLPLMWLSTREGTDWPAWVQAVGSIIGIGIAIAVPRQQRNNEERRRVADVAALDHLSALKLFRNINDVHSFATQTHKQMIAGVASDGSEVAIFERYLGSVANCFEQETSVNRATIASHVRGVLTVMIFSLSDPHSRDLPEKVGKAVEILGKYKIDAKTALELAASVEGISLADV